MRPAGSRPTTRIRSHQRNPIRREAKQNELIVVQQQEDVTPYEPSAYLYAFREFGLRYLNSLLRLLCQTKRQHICFSAKTSANFTQEIIESKLEKRGRRLLGPPAGRVPAQPGRAGLPGGGMPAAVIATGPCRTGPAHASRRHQHDERSHRCLICTSRFTAEAGPRSISGHDARAV